jgi:cytochrome c
LATLAMVGLVALLPTLGFALPDPGRGETLAVAHCAACHAIGSAGDSPSPKAPAFRTLSSRYPLDNLQEALAEGITVGHEGQEMPEFAFSPDDVADLIAHMKRVAGQR